MGAIDGPAVGPRVGMSVGAQLPVKEPELPVNISVVVADDASKHTAMLKAVAPLNM